jgi:hypothetical protein
MLRAYLLCLLTVACDPPPPERYPGPCRAESEGTWCAYQYDDAGRLVSMACEASGISYRWTWTRVYEGDRLVSWSGGGTDGGGSDSFAWTFGETQATGDFSTFAYDSLTGVEGTATYDAVGLELFGHPFDPLNEPWAPDAMIRIVTTRSNGKSGMMSTSSATYTYDGPPRVGTRVRTGSDGSTRTFTYDELGRIVSDDGATFLYDGDLLLTDGDVTYTYDAAGNLLTRTGASASGAIDTMTFDYSCWDTTSPTYCTLGEIDCGADVVRECQSVRGLATWVDIGAPCTSEPACWLDSENNIMREQRCRRVGACAIEREPVLCNGVCVEDTSCIRVPGARLAAGCDPFSSEPCTGNMVEIVVDAAGEPWSVQTTYLDRVPPYDAVASQTFVQHGELQAIVGGAGFTYGAAIAALDGGGVVIAGITDHALDGATAFGRNDTFVQTFDDVLAPGPVVQLGGAGQDLARAIAAGDGYVLVAGETDGTIGADPDLGGDDVFIARVEGTNVVWARQWGTEQDDRVLELAIDADGNAFVVGTDATDTFVSRLDASGAPATRIVLEGIVDGRVALLGDDEGGVYVGRGPGIEHVSAAGVITPIAIERAAHVLDLANDGDELLVSGAADPGGVFYARIDRAGRASDSYAWVFTDDLGFAWIHQRIDTATSDGTVWLGGEEVTRRYPVPIVGQLTR